MMKRKWIFHAETFDEDGGFYLDAEGKEVDCSDAIPFIGDIEDARNEANRRANLWEEKHNSLYHQHSVMARVTYESLGEI